MINTERDNPETKSQTDEQPVAEEIEITEEELDQRQLALAYLFKVTNAGQADTDWPFNPMGDVWSRFNEQSQ